MTVRIVESTAGGPEPVTVRERWAHYFVLLFIAGALIIGLNLRDSTTGATVVYTNPEVGVTAQYPKGWLIDSNGQYVFRARDMASAGYKTTIQLDVLPVSQQTTTRNIVDSLVLDRAQTLSNFRVLSQEPFTLPSGLEATRVLYTFVDSDENPFLQSLPVVVEAADVLAIEGGQAVIISFLSDASTFDADYATFEQFLNDLDF